MKLEDSKTTLINHNNDFYDLLPELPGFEDAIGKTGEPVPREWYIALTDVEKSTEAVEKGAYKQVNVSGALSIIALARLYGTLKRPFVFGGDGMTFLLDPEHVDQARETLSRVIRDVKKFFEIEIRAAIIPVSHLYNLGFTFRVTKVRMSSDYVQAHFHGSGITAAEILLKTLDSSTCSFFLTESNDEENVSYEGFTCRWQDIPSPDGETSALIVETRPGTDPLPILREIETIIGKTPSYHPLRVDLLKAGGKNSTWKLPALVTHKKKSGFKYKTTLVLEAFGIFMLNLAIKFNLPIRYKMYSLNKAREQNIANSDYKKFEGSIKLIFSATTKNTDTLLQRLQQLYHQEMIFFGLHRAKAAHMTCIATLETGDDIHFLDAVNGGYSLAAKSLKRQKEVSGKPDVGSAYRDFSQVYEEIFPLGDLTYSFISQLLSPGQRVLDLGCATGELVRRLSTNGFPALGVDFEENLVSEGISRLEAESKNSGKNDISAPVVLQVGNIFEPQMYDTLSNHVQFNMVTCLGNTFVHGQTEEDFTNFFNGVNKVLFPEGKVLINFLHYDSILQDQDFYFPVISHPPYQFFRSYTPMKNKKLGFHIRLLCDKQQMFHNSLELTPMSLREFRSHAQQAGFTDIQWYSDFSGSPLESSSTMVVAVLKK